MHLTRKSRRILGFIQGFALLHKVGPTREQILEYEAGNTFHHGLSTQLGTVLARLQQHGLITKHGRRFHVVLPQRFSCFAYNRNTGMLEQFHGTETDPAELLGP